MHTGTCIIISRDLYLTGVTPNAWLPGHTSNTINENVSRDTAPMHEVSEDERDC